MAKITEDYVSFETAKLLKEKGFDGECRDYYNIDGHFYSEDFKSNWNHGGSETITIFSAPTLQMARKWLKEKYNIHIEVVHLNANRHTYYLYRYYSCQPERYVQHTNPEYSTYEQACEEAIRYCLEKLIK